MLKTSLAINILVILECIPCICNTACLLQNLPLRSESCMLANVWLLESILNSVIVTTHVVRQHEFILGEVTGCLACWCVLAWVLSSLQQYAKCLCATETTSAAMTPVDNLGPGCRYINFSTAAATHKLISWPN